MKTTFFITALFLIGAGCTNAPARSSLPKEAVDASIVIDGLAVPLKGATHPFGPPIYGDLNGDGVQDAAMFVEQVSVGSGTFYYVAAALNRDGGYRGLNAVLLGDRIAPQTIEIRDGGIMANYAERKPGEPFTTQPSVGVSNYLRVEGDRLTVTAKP